MNVQTTHKPIIGSYTALRNYQNCPLAMYHRNIAKTYPFVMTDAVRLGNDIHKAFEHRLRDKEPLPPLFAKWESFAAPFDGKPVHVELSLGITKDGKPCGFWDKDCWFRGKIDTALVSGNRAHLFDWKSGSSKYEDPFELEISAVLLQAKFPKATQIEGRYVYLAEDRLGMCHDLSETNTVVRPNEAPDGRDRARSGEGLV